MKGGTAKVALVLAGFRNRGHAREMPGRLFPLSVLLAPLSKFAQYIRIIREHIKFLFQKNACGVPITLPQEIKRMSDKTARCVGDRGGRGQFVG